LRMAGRANPPVEPPTPNPLTLIVQISAFHLWDAVLLSHCFPAGRDENGSLGSSGAAVLILSAGRLRNVDHSRSDHLLEALAKLCLGLVQRVSKSRDGYPFDLSLDVMADVDRPVPWRDVAGQMVGIRQRGYIENRNRRSGRWP
jgi:hypothetical protein